MQTGVRRAAAFFSREIESHGDSTKTNAEKLHEEAARRKQLREAKAKLNQALLDANRHKSAEEVAKEMKIQSERVAAEEAARKKKAEEDEKAVRAARKAQLNAQWSGKGGDLTPSGTPMSSPRGK
jgi:membrane protein involved in colicin uptake